MHFHCALVNLTPVSVVVVKFDVTFLELNSFIKNIPTHLFHLYDFLMALYVLYNK
jgi:hypothetical protein